VSLFSFRENPGIQRYPKNEMQWKHWINEVAKWIASQAAVTTAQTTADTAQTTATTAQTAADAAAASAIQGQVWGEDVGAEFRTDPAGVWPVGDPSKDVVVQFFGAGLTVSPTTRTIRVTLTSATGLVTLTDQASAGDATTVVITHASPATDGNALVTHTASGAIGKATGQAVDNSTEGGSPGK